MNSIPLLFLLSITQLAASCTLHCSTFNNIYGELHANCTFETNGNATKCELKNFNDDLVTAGINPTIRVVNIYLDFSQYITRVELWHTSQPVQKLIVKVSREHFDIKTLYLIGKFEISDRDFFSYFPRIELIVLRKVYFSIGIPIFKDLNQVTRIYSDKTNIKGNNLMIGEDFVSGLPRLDFLYFRTEGSGIISFANPKVFNELNALTRLNLGRISFNNVDPRILTPLVNLKSFVAVWAEISDTTFLEQSNLKNIIEINLAHNRLDSLKGFANFPKLTKLALLNNQISNLVRSDFKGLEGLKELDLQENQVGNMNDDVFYELRDLRMMTLYGNKITTLSSKQFEHLQSLTGVQMRYNPFVCECHLKWIAEVNSKYGIDFEGTCYDAHNNGDPVTDVSNYATCTEIIPLECFNRSYDICRENSRCISSVSTFFCPCIEGYREINGSCIDINECAEGTSGCKYHCSNLPGTFECCLQGHRVDMEGNCVDLNECLDPRFNRCTQNCNNTIGSYYCECNAGYQLKTDGITCEDIDECSNSDNGCSYQCENEEGSYKCECPNGYQLDTDKKTCYDENNCTYKHSECEKYCEDNNGDFVCVCQEGFLNTIVNGFQRCENINECEIPQKCSQGCEDSIGSYTCLCDAGSKLDSDNQTCVDIDECMEGTDNCRPLERCVNVQDSFECTCKYDHYIEGTSQCGFLPISTYFAIGGGGLALVFIVVSISCLLCCVLFYKRHRKRREEKRVKKLIYKEVNLQRTARHNTAYDPLNYIELPVRTLDEDSRPNTANGYERMSGGHSANLYESISIAVNESYMGDDEETPSKFLKHL